jgi:flagellin
MRVNANIAALNASRNLGVSNSNLSKSLEKLSSGYRINRAADDAAGLAISEGLRAEIKGTVQAQRNAQDGVSFVQTAEGALTEVHSMLQRMRELAVQAANGTSDGTAEQAEVTALVAEIGAVGTRTTFAGQSVFADFGTTAFNLQVGAGAADQIQISDDLRITTSGANGILSVNISTLNLGTDAGAQAALTTLDTAIADVSTARSSLGSVQNRLEHTISNLGVAVENLTASESRVRDVDMASEMVSFTRSQILSQAGTAMLAQANQVPQGILSLLR